MKYSKNTYMKALAALAALRATLPKKEQHTVDFVAEAITEKADRDTRPATRADRLSAMSDEEMAEWLIRMSEGDQSIKFCKGRPECDADCDADRDIPQARCVECLTDWLRQPCEEATT